jgi:hypothetical protein
VTAIISMLRFGSRFSVTLACGHKFSASADEAKRDQLFIGKPVECRECNGGEQ